MSMMSKINTEAKTTPTEYTGKPMILRKLFERISDCFDSYINVKFGSSEYITREG
jgi:hypothetical protein